MIISVVRPSTAIITASHMSPSWAMTTWPPVQEIKQSKCGRSQRGMKNGPTLGIKTGFDRLPLLAILKPWSAVQTIRAS
jgi:hypothetical protein